MMMYSQEKTLSLHQKMICTRGFIHSDAISICRVSPLGWDSSEGFLTKNNKTIK